MVTYFTADHHLSHGAILDLCGRPFKSIDQHDAELIRHYNAVVQPDDTVYFLGDLTLKTAEHYPAIARLVNKLRGHKHLILGNHDSLKPFTYVELGFETVHTALQVGDLYLAHDPAIVQCKRDQLWLVGHVHQLYRVCGNTINVGVDVWDFAPVSLDTINQLTEWKRTVQ